MDDFLLSITLGEYIAAANARDFAKFFERMGDEEISRSYREIASDELRHFSLLKQIIRGGALIPAQIRAIYKGVLLSTPPTLSIESIFERMAVMHTVFEGAAFAYMSLLSKFAFTDEKLRPIQGIAKIIMVDEARHMAEGFQAIDFMKQSMVSDGFVNETRLHVERNAVALRNLPAQTIKENDEFSARLYQLYDDNVSRNMKRVFK